MPLALQFLNKLPVVVLLLAGAILNVAGDIAAKYWSQTPGRLLYWIGLGAYMLASVLYMPTLLRQGLIVSSLAWSLFSILGYLAVGFFLFHETLSVQQVVGVGLGIIAILLLGGK